MKLYVIIKKRFRIMIWSILAVTLVCWGLIFCYIMIEREQLQNVSKETTLRQQLATRGLHLKADAQSYREIHPTGGSRGGNNTRPPYCRLSYTAWTPDGRFYSQINTEHNLVNHGVCQKMYAASASVVMAQSLDGTAKTTRLDLELTEPPDDQVIYNGGYNGRRILIGLFALIYIVIMYFILRGPGWHPYSKKARAKRAAKK